MATQFNQVAADQVQTTSAATQIVASVEVPNGTVVLWEIFVMAVRSDGATKTWQAQSVLRKAGGVMTVIETIPAALNLFATASDETALTGVTISLFNDNTYIGVNCTGQAGQTIDWRVELTGRGLGV